MVRWDASSPFQNTTLAHGSMFCCSLKQLPVPNNDWKQRERALCPGSSLELNGRESPVLITVPQTSEDHNMSTPAGNSRKRAKGERLTWQANTEQLPSSWVELAFNYIISTFISGKSSMRRPQEGSLIFHPLIEGWSTFRRRWVVVWDDGAGQKMDGGRTLGLGKMVILINKQPTATGAEGSPGNENLLEIKRTF
ncbi:hypothetical protein TCAL_07585 [Tigriopus californicus]|uniref:Uncharacterized protein n=1 Tax=Tigriopus californicus TaxID=6832 RepID=A0A553PM92_TIGCA|nr:hypothetical protein TCAL_07585 [Tigriopus californicus]|eukprot:TCALIF_07585-PA protein Name:"Protein of unknown function" AED:0.97 eAED:1.00 QI:0/0/0/0.5/1/1/2/0/194